MRLMQKRVDPAINGGVTVFIRTVTVRGEVRVAVTS